MQIMEDISAMNEGIVSAMVISMGSEYRKIFISGLGNIS